MRVKFITTGLQFIKDKVSFTVGFHSGEADSILGNLYRRTGNRVADRINKPSAQAPNWLKGAHLAANRFGARRLGLEKKKKAG
jgi:hypothetical protein